MGLAPPAAGPRENCCERQSALFALPATVLLMTKAHMPLAVSLKSYEVDAAPYAPVSHFALPLQVPDSAGPRKICPLPNTVNAIMKRVATTQTTTLRCIRLMIVFISIAPLKIHRHIPCAAAPNP